MKRFFVFAFALLTACASTHMTSDIQPGDAENAIRAANSAFVTNLRAGNIDRLVDSFYAENAVVMPANAPAFNGRESIKALFRQFAAGNPDITLTTDNVMQSCDMATETGHYDLRMGSNHEAGKYVVVWRKINGEWRAVVDSFSANAPPR